MIRLLLLVGLTSSLYAADNRDIEKLERIRTHFDRHIVKTSNHHERAEIFNDAVKNIDRLSALDEGLKNQTFKHFLTTITRIEEETLDTIVIAALKVAESVERAENIEKEKHALLAQVDDLQNAPLRARNSAKHYIDKLFDARRIALAGDVGATAIQMPEKSKEYYASAPHESTASVHTQSDTLDRLVNQFYTEIHDRRLTSRHMQQKLDGFITKVNALSVSDTEKERAIKDVTQAAQARLQEQGDKLPARGAKKEPKRRLKGSVAHTEEETKGHRYVKSRKTVSKVESKESVTQEAARLRRERAQQQAQ